MKNFFTIFALAACALTASNVSAADEAAKTSSPLKVLLVAGGCCHDYPVQAKLLKEGIEQRINAEVTVVLSESKKTGDDVRDL